MGPLRAGTGGTSTPVWTGRWVQDALGVRLHDAGDRAGDRDDGRDDGRAAGDGGDRLTSLVGMAVRRNPRRAHLLVSRVLGKHVPTDPDVVHAGGRRLGELVAGALDPSPDGVVVLGFAETATALGHVVADVLGAPYLHSTRRRVEHVVPTGGFEESHSHAADHLLLPAEPELLARLAGDGPLVLVDDEISTGSTALHTVAALQETHPRGWYVLATLVDLRSNADRERVAAVAAAHGTRIDVVALAAGSVDLPSDVLTRGERVVAAQEAKTALKQATSREASQEASSRGTTVDSAEIVRITPACWPSEVKEGGRHGFLPADRAPLEAALAALATDVAAATGPASRVHVLGFEELMYAPLRLAQALASALPGEAVVTFSTTTSSPILVVDDPGYPIRSALVFPAHDAPVGGPGVRYAYNVAPPASDPAARFDAVVLVVDSSGDRPELTHPGGLLPLLASVTDRVVLVVLPEHHPGREGR